uniref:Uncharacterized protein n=1 Tax=Oryza nivara TaxID=4536 RepID=A0A0E0FL95_ORYNI
MPSSRMVYSQMSIFTFQQSIPVSTGTKILVVGSNQIQRLVEFGIARWKRKRATTSWIGDFNAIAVWIDATTATRNDEPPPPPGMTSRHRLDFNSAGTGNDEPLPPGVSGSTSASLGAGKKSSISARRIDDFNAAAAAWTSTPPPPGTTSRRRLDQRCRRLDFNSTATGNDEPPPPGSTRSLLGLQLRCRLDFNDAAA